MLADLCIWALQSVWCCRHRPSGLCAKPRTASAQLPCRSGPAKGQHFDSQLGLSTTEPDALYYPVYCPFWVPIPLGRMRSEQSHRANKASLGSKAREPDPRPARKSGWPEFCCTFDFECGKRLPVGAGLPVRIAVSRNTHLWKPWLFVSITSCKRVRRRVAQFVTLQVLRISAGQWWALRPAWESLCAKVLSKSLDAELLSSELLRAVKEPEGPCGQEHILLDVGKELGEGGQALVK